MLSQRNFLTISVTGMAVLVSTFISIIPVKAEDSFLDQNKADNSEYTIYTIAQRRNGRYRNDRERRYRRCLRRADSRRERRECEYRFGRRRDQGPNNRERRYRRCLRNANTRRERRRCQNIRR